MDEYSIASPREAAARALGQDAARTFFSDPVEGETMEAFVLGRVTDEVVQLTRTMQKSAVADIKQWRSRHFAAPIALSLAGIVVAIATTPRTGPQGAAAGPILGVIGLAAGVTWLIVTAIKASSKMSDAQQRREAETGRLLTVAREAAAQLRPELEAAPAQDAAPDRHAAPDQDAAPDRHALPTANAEAPRVGARRPAHRPSTPPPAGQPFGVSQQGAEYLAAAWMRHLGDPDAAPTDYAEQRSAEAAGTRHLARVVNDADTVGVDDVRTLVEAANARGLDALVFASGTYTDEALSLAEQAAVALFTYDPVLGTLEGANDLGRAAVVEGLL